MKSMEIVSKEVRVKDEPICYSQSISNTSRTNQPNKIQTNYEQSIKQEKRTREDILSDDQPKNRKGQSMKVKEEPIEIQILKSHIESMSEVKAEEKFSAT